MNILLRNVILWAHQVLEGSDEDGLWLEPVKIDRMVLSQQPWIRMTEPEPTATMDDVYVLFCVLLCNLHSKAGTIFNRDWFENRVNDLVRLFPGVSVPPAVPLYSESQADAVSAVWKTVALHHNRDPLHDHRRPFPVENCRDRSDSTSQRGLILVEFNWLRIQCNRLQVTAPMVPAVPQPLDAATDEVPAVQDTLQCRD
ncbi:hypothetical protein HPB51_012354 [Rhipicephalus microplus]|uniref:Uncharacterized protein n=1 Tax=Rhipicephalus microplus TaxID=6941 RepID=A0A9J6DGQ1_RHIMP|nr:hypothetical protein HPB51_012354 [Rhipicephalus microplus]